MIDAPSRLRLIRKATALARIDETRDLSIDEKAARQSGSLPTQNVSSFFFFGAESDSEHAALWLSILQNERNQTIFTPQESPHYRLSFFLNTEEK